MADQAKKHAIKKTSDPRIRLARVTHVVEAGRYALAQAGDETICFQLDKGSHFEIEGEEHVFMTSTCKTKVNVGEQIVCILDAAHHPHGGRIPDVWTTYVRWCNPDVALNAKHRQAPPQQEQKPQPPKESLSKKNPQPTPDHQPVSKDEGLGALVFPEPAKAAAPMETIFSATDPRRFRVFRNTKTTPTRVVRLQIASGRLSSLQKQAEKYRGDDIEVDVEVGQSGSGTFVRCRNNPFELALADEAAA